MSTPAHQPRPFAEKRLVLTRSAADNARWAPALRELGAEVIELECIRTELTGAGEKLTAELEAADWVVLASRKGAEAAAKILELTGAPDFAQPRLACVGGATALAAKPLFGAPECLAPGGTMASLATELSARLQDEFHQVNLELAAEGGRRDLEPSFTDSPHEVRRLELYRTHAAKSPEDPPPPLARLTGGPVDLVLLASPSAWIGLNGLASLPKFLPCVTLGPTTSAALVEAGRRPRAEAQSRDLRGLIDAASRALHISPAAFLPRP
jgi:uroporphyrinogen-III synthase